MSLTMRASIMRGSAVVVDEIPVPELREGEVLVKTLSCGICGSDLHALKHGPHLVKTLRRAGSPLDMDLSRDVIMGHEFCAEIVDFGPAATRKLSVGTRVCSVPFLTRGKQFNHIGYSNDAPGGFGEFMALSEDMLLPVPDAVSDAEAALTEPLAVGLHAVEKARLESRDVPLVIGCGPVGLAVIAALRIRGAGPIVAADFSANRRRLALQMGADVVVDPAVHSPYESWQQVAVWKDAETAPPLAPWDPGPPLCPAVIFECVGVPGIIDQIMAAAPAATRIVVVGVCMQADQFEPIFGITKELDLRFVWGYTPAEFAETLGNIAAGRIATAPLITGRVGVSEVAVAFEALASPGSHAKIIVEPWR